MAWEDWVAWGNLQDYLSFLEYLLWVFTPLAIVFILPFVIVILLYLSILFLHVYKRKNQLREAYSYNLWDCARKTLATLWDGHGAIWHGVYGMARHGTEGPAVGAGGGGRRWGTGQNIDSRTILSLSKCIESTVCAVNIGIDLFCNTV